MNNNQEPQSNYPEKTNQERQELLDSIDDADNNKQKQEILNQFSISILIVVFHTGSVHQKFSSTISLSVGGIISDHLRPSRVYVELVIPDEEVEVHPEHVRGEKEVFVQRIKSEWISRVYVDSEQMRNELITDPNSNIGKFVIEKNVEVGQEVNRWRWDEPTENYLPKKLFQSENS